MEDQELLDFKNKYQNNPVAFVEDFYGIKLHAYQKQIVKTMLDFNNVKGLSFGGCNNMKQWVHDMWIEYAKAMEMSFQHWTKDGIEVYKKGVLVKIIKNE